MWGEGTAKLPFPYTCIVLQSIYFLNYLPQIDPNSDYLQGNQLSDRHKRSRNSQKYYRDWILTHDLLSECSSGSRRVQKLTTEKQN